MPKLHWLAGITLMIVLPAIVWAQRPRVESQPPPAEIIASPSNSNQQSRPAVIPTSRNLPAVIVPYTMADQTIEYSETFFGRIGAWLTGGSCRSSTFDGDLVCQSRPGWFSFWWLRSSCKTPVVNSAYSYSRLPCSFCLPMPWHPRSRGHIKPLCTNTYCVQQGESSIARACDNSYRRGRLTQPVCDGPIDGVNKTPPRDAEH